MPPVSDAPAPRRRRPRLLGAEPRAQLRARVARARVGLRSLRGEPRALRPAYPEARLTDDLDEVLADDTARRRGDRHLCADPPPARHARARRRQAPVRREAAGALDRRGRELVEAAEAADRRLMVGHLLLFHPGSAQVKSLIDSGELGELYYLYGEPRRTSARCAPTRTPSGASARTTSPCCSTSSGERPTEAAARGECYVRPGIEDVVFGYLKFPSGVVAHLHLSWLDPHKMRRLTVVGSDKMAVFDDMEADRKVTVYDKGIARPRADTYGEYVARALAATSRSRASRATSRCGSRSRSSSTAIREARAPLSDGRAGPRSRRGARGRCSARSTRAVGVTRSTPSARDAAPRPARPEPARGRRRRGRRRRGVRGQRRAARRLPGRRGCRIGDGAVLGKRPALGGSSTASRDPLPGLVLGEGCIVSTHAVVFAGSDARRRHGRRRPGGRARALRLGERVRRRRAARRSRTTRPSARASSSRPKPTSPPTATLEDDVFVAPCVVTTNDNFMGRTEKRKALMRGPLIRRGARIGGGAMLLPGVEIGEEAFVGAGALVLRDVPAQTVSSARPRATCATSRPRSCSARPPTTAGRPSSRRGRAPRSATCRYVSP